METIIKTQNYGEVTVKGCVIDVDGTNLEEGVVITSNDNIFETIEVAGFTVEDFDEDIYDIDAIIEMNL